MRGSPVKVGNVYVCNRPPAFRDFRVVVGIANKVNGRPAWNNIVLLHFNAALEIVGCSRVPEAYCSNHWDLVGVADKLPKLKIKWNCDPGQLLQRNLRGR